TPSGVPLGDPERVEDVGEFGLIARLHSLLPPCGRPVWVGPGDDAAAVPGPGERAWILTCDVLVEGQHFRRELTSAYDLGRKALAVNVSDVAAMGGEPRYAIVSLGLPPETETSWVEDLYRGLGDEAALWGAAIVGGNISRSGATRAEGQSFVDVFLLGEAPREELLTRAGARPGDELLVTGTLGDAAAGLFLLHHPEVSPSEEGRETLLSAHRRPRPRVREARAVARSGLASAMIDISDGLASDLRHLCEASGVGAEVREESLPLSPALRAAAERAGLAPLEWALGGGEDYELLLAAPPHAVGALQRAVREAKGVPLTAIGRVREPESGLSLLGPNGRRELSPLGWDHMRRKA
ncbi:MAG: thiamine-phosphate kinase, partial [Nitrospinota bacterium]